MSHPHYKHTQIGWAIIIALVAVGAVMVPVGLQVELMSTTWVVGGVVIVALLLFNSLTVTVDQQRLQARFGIGLIRKTIPLAKVRSFHKIRTPWYFGWGIRLFPGGILYNVSGLWSVELQLHSGGRLRIGTDEPDALVAAIREVIGEPEPLTEPEKAKQKSRALLFAGIVVGAMVAMGGLIAVMFHLQLKPPVVTVTPETMSVGMFLYGEDYPLDEVTSATLQERIPRIRARTNGFALGATLRGHFAMDELGRGKLFIEADQPPYVVVRLKEGYTIINFEDPAQTRALHTQLLKALQARGRR